MSDDFIESTQQESLPENVQKILDDNREPDQIEAAPAEVQDKGQEQSQKQEDMVELQYDGKTIQVSKDKLHDYASQGYHAAKLNRQVKEERQEIQKLREQLKEYEQVQEWAKQNPKDWEAARSAYFSRQAQNPTTDPGAGSTTDSLDPRIQGLQQKIQSLEEKQNAESSQRAQELLNEEWAAIEKEYDYLDLSGIDEEGYTMKEKVEQHAAENGYSSLATAFRELNYDRIVKHVEERAKERVVQEIQNKRKLGKLNVAAKRLSNPPKPRVTYSKGDSYNDLTRRAMAGLEAGVFDDN